MSDEDRPAAGGPVPAVADGSAPSPAAHSLPPARSPKADGLLLRVRPLVAAVVGVALGVACGQWLIGRLAARLPPAQVRAAASVEATGRVETAAPFKASSEDGGGTPAAAEASAAPAEADGPQPQPAPDAAVEGASRRPPAVVESSRRKAVGDGASAAAGETSRGSATAGPAGRAAGERLGRPGGGRCGLSLSANSLSLRAGGSDVVTAAVDELPGRGVVTASTRNWPDIAVFSEPAGGGRARYTIISVSRRPGSYAVTFKSPCGTKTLPVSVKQP